MVIFLPCVAIDTMASRWRTGPSPSHSWVSSQTMLFSSFASSRGKPTSLLQLKTIEHSPSKSTELAPGPDPGPGPLQEAFSRTRLGRLGDATDVSRLGGFTKGLSMFPAASASFACCKSASAASFERYGPRRRWSERWMFLRGIYRHSAFQEASCVPAAALCLRSFSCSEAAFGSVLGLPRFLGSTRLCCSSAPTLRESAASPVRRVFCGRACCGVSSLGDLLGTSGVLRESSLPALGDPRGRGCITRPTRLREEGASLVVSLCAVAWAQGWDFSEGERDGLVGSDDKASACTVVLFLSQCRLAIGKFSSLLSLSPSLSSSLSPSPVLFLSPLLSWSRFFLFAPSLSAPPSHCLFLALPPRAGSDGAPAEAGGTAKLLAAQAMACWSLAAWGPPLAQGPRPWKLLAPSKVPWIAATPGPPVPELGSSGIPVRPLLRSLLHHAQESPPLSGRLEGKALSAPPDPEPSSSRGGN
eukprot:scaffold48_cov311-Pinguiococcus_pyrenoidosus.AAC.71